MDSTLPQPSPLICRPTRFPNSFSHTSSSTIRSTWKPFFRFRHCSARSTNEKCHRAGPTDRPSPELHQSHLHSTQKDRRGKTSLQPQSFEPICGLPPLQDGSNTRHLSYDKTARLSSLYRPIRCLPTSTISPSISPISSLSLAKPIVSIPYYTIRPQHCSLLVYQNHTTDRRMGQTAGNSDSSLPRRSDYNGRIERNNPSPHNQSLVLLAKSGLVSQLGEIQPTPNSIIDRKSTRLNSSHSGESRMPSSA